MARAIRRGRSLRELDLKTRLFKYPCSYMVYSNAFQQLPLRAKNAVYDKLIEALRRLPLDQRNGPWNLDKA